MEFSFDIMMTSIKNLRLQCEFFWGNILNNKLMDITHYFDIMLIEKSRLDPIQENARKLQHTIEAWRKDEISEDVFMKKTKVVCSQQKNFQLQVQCREHMVHIDEPQLNGGDDTAITPVEMLLCAYASCLEVSWIVYASVFDAKVDSITVEIEGEMDRRYILGKKEYPARYNKIDVVFNIKSEESMKKLNHILERVQKTCGVGGSLHPDIEKTFSIRLID